MVYSQLIDHLSDNEHAHQCCGNRHHTKNGIWTHFFWNSLPLFSQLRIFREFANRVTYLVYVVCKGPFTPSENEKFL